MTKVRLRWHRVKLASLSVRAVSDSLRGAEYSSKVEMGFKVEETRRDHVIAKFIHRHEWDDEVEDPSGTKFAFHGVEVRQFRFRLHLHGPELELENAPRAFGTFLGFLGTCLGRAIILDDVAVTPAQWLASLEKLAGRVSVRAVTTSGVTLSASTNASVHVEGTEDVRKHHAKFLNGHRGTVERVVCQLLAPNQGRCEFGIGARAAISGGTDDTIDLLRSALRSAMSS